MAIEVATDRNELKVIRVFSAQEVVASGTATSTIVIDLKQVNGSFGAQWAVTGDGTVDITYLSTIDGTNYLTPSLATPIAEDLTKTTGTSGTDIVSFSPEPCSKMKFKLTETGGANSVTVTLDILVQ